MITDLVQIRRLGEKKREENGRFRAWLRRHNFAERRFKHIAEEVTERTDCLACANCCRVATTRVTERDIERLAKFLGMHRTELLRDCTVETPDEGRILRRNGAGCLFLNGNECTVYDGRPDTCRDFPHLTRGPGSFLSRMWQMPDRATYCPIVYNSLESFKDETRFQR